VIGIVFMAAGGVQVLIPPTGKDGLDWIRDVDDAGGAFFAGAWLVILGGILGIPALIGFYNALRGVGPWLIFAPILSAVGLTLVTLSHLIPIAMAYELVPGYTAADVATKTSLATTADTFAVLALVVNYTGDVVLWGVVVPMFALAVLKTSVVPRWIGWLGLGVGIFAGLGNALSPASSIIDGVTSSASSASSFGSRPWEWRFFAASAELPRQLRLPHRGFPASPTLRAPQRVCRPTSKGLAPSAQDPVGDVRGERRLKQTRMLEIHRLLETVE
jgi:hypothetical protein